MTFLRQLNLEVKDDMAKHLKVETLSIKVKLVLIYQAIKVDLKKGQEATKKCISIVKDNVDNITWAEVQKDAKA